MSTMYVILISHYETSKLSHMVSCYVIVDIKMLPRKPVASKRQNKCPQTCSGHVKLIFAHNRVNIMPTLYSEVRVKLASDLQ